MRLKFMRNYRKSKREWKDFFVNALGLEISSIESIRIGIEPEATFRIIEKLNILSVLTVIFYLLHIIYHYH